MHIKKIFENILIFLVAFISIDVIISNTKLNIDKKSCSLVDDKFLQYKINCKGKIKIRPDMPAVNFITNNLGVRVNPDRKYLNPNKIFIFGSSMVLAEHYEFEKGVIGILQERIKDFDFYNFSGPYYSPSVHLYNLKKNIKNEIKPSKIILFLSMSDILWEGSFWSDNNNSNDYKPYVKNMEFLKDEINNKKKFTHKNLKLTRSIIYKFKKYKKNLFNDKNININSSIKVRTTVQAGYTYTPLKKLSPFYDNGEFKIGKEKIQKKITLISNLLKKENIEFYLVIFPFADTLEYGQKEFNWENYAKEICIDNCNFVNAFEEFKQYSILNQNWYRDIFIFNDEHYNENGHKIFANSLLKKIFNQ